MRARMMLRRAVPVVFAVALAASACSSATGGRPAATVPVGPPALVDTIDLGMPVEDIALDAKRGLLYLPHSEETHRDGSVLVVDAATKKVTKTIKTGGVPFRVALDPELQTLYVVTLIDGGLSVVNVVDTGSGTLKEPIRPAGGASTVAVDPSTHAVYITPQIQATGIDVRDGRTHQQTATIATSGGAMAVDPQNRRLYVGQVVSPTEHDAAVFVVDTATNQVVANVRVDGLVDAVAVVPTGHTVYVANTERGTVSVIDGGNNTLSKTIKVNNGPRTLGVDASNDFVYVGHSDKAELLEVIDGHTGAVTASIETARSAFAMAVNSQTHTAYVQNSDDEQGRGVVGSISVIAPRP